jgi:hypothetical protein
VEKKTDERKKVDKEGWSEASVRCVGGGREVPAGMARRGGQDAVKNQGHGDRDATKEGHDN